jgi:hypothetical protein
MIIHDNYLLIQNFDDSASIFKVLLTSQWCCENKQKISKLIRFNKLSGRLNVWTENWKIIVLPTHVAYLSGLSQ